MDMFDSKARRVGTSIGVLIPKEVTEEEGISPGTPLRLAIIKKDFNQLEKMFGAAKGFKPFKRDRKDRF